MVCPTCGWVFNRDCEDCQKQAEEDERRGITVKFITIEDEDGKEDIFVFPKHIHHDAMMEVLRGIKNQTHGSWKRVLRQPIAAGFVNEKGQCYGESVTLNLSSREEDTALLNAQMNAMS